jgi:hypothetical protein
MRERAASTTLGAVMIWKPWRDRLLYLAMSLFVGWHAIAILVAPAPYGSPVIERLHALFRPYLTLFRLESPWSFFTNVAGVKLPQFRYIIVGADGREHTFAPVAEFNWYHPRYNWIERIYWAITDNPVPERIGSYFVPSLCRRHAALKPVAITFLTVMPGDFWPDDQLSGRRPLDPDNVWTHTLMDAACPDE